MKKQILSIALLLSSFGAMAQVSIVKGILKADTIKGEKPIFWINKPFSDDPSKNPFYTLNDISLFKIEDGDLKVIATTQLNEDGTFAFKFKPTYEGFYVIGNSKNIFKGRFPLYLKPGDNADVSIQMNKYHVDLVGNNTQENQVLTAWDNLTEVIRHKAVYFGNIQSTYVDFFPVFEDVILKAEAFRKTINTSNTAFNRLMRELTYYDMDYLALQFIYTPRVKHPKKEELINYYNGIVVNNKFPDNDILSLPIGKNLLRMYVDQAAGITKPLPPLEKKLAFLSTDLQKGEYIMTMAPFIKYRNEMDELVSKFGLYLQTPSQKKRLEELRPKLLASKKGVKAFDFTYPDTEGKMVSLSDFTGKVVLVDVWATWCTPCLGEIPYLKDLEKEFHGKDVVFMSVSTDKAEDKNKWLAMVKQKEMSGVQLHAGSGTKISQDYKINAIPRFLLIDKKGNIISEDAPRPSDPKLKEMILGALNNSGA